MIGKENYQVCSHCYESIKNKGMPFLILLETILEIFCLLKEPVAVINEAHVAPILEYLEINRYIVTTEFPDASKKNRDIILAIPLGFQEQEDICLFCFDENNHE